MSEAPKPIASGRAGMLSLTIKERTALYAAYLPFVKRGGVIAFHDFGSRASGVTQAIFEATKAGRFAEIVGVANTIIAFKM